MHEQDNTSPSWRPWQLGWQVWLATGGWVGLIPIAPGTLGSGWGVALSFVLSGLPWWWQLPTVVVVCGLGIPLCTSAVVRLGRGKDPGCIVYDEIASLPITFFGLPMQQPEVVIVGFALHRLFDISKPPPARQLERWPNGLGIMADDWVAGLYSHLVLRLLILAGLPDWL